MKRTLILTVIAALSVALIASDSLARGGRGGFGGGGGGRSIGSGGSRPSVGGASRTPSMSRQAKPSTSRPSVSRPSTGRPTASRPSTNRPTVSRPSTGGTNRPNVGGAKPSIGGGSNRPSLGGGGERPKVGGDQVTNRPDYNRPGSSNRPSRDDLDGFLGGSGSNRPNVGDRNDIGDRVNVGDRNNVGDRVNLGDRTNVGDININVGNKVSFDREKNVSSIRNKWNNVDRRPFDRDHWDRNWSNRDRNHWRWHGGWSRYPQNWCWRPTTWATCGTWFAAWNWAKPYNYNYGTTIVYRDNYVYVGDKQYASADAYYQQAETIASTIPADVEPEKIEWMPLGVFAVAEQNATDSGMLVQLAVSKEGILAGVFYNDATKSERPLEGMVDQETQRAVWRFADGENSEIVMETGIYNLTQDEATALVHFGPDKTQTWLMVRLPEPQE